MVDEPAQQRPAGAPPEGAAGRPGPAPGTTPPGTPGAAPPPAGPDPAMPSSSAAPSEGPLLPASAADSRSRHFLRLSVHPSTLSYATIAVISAFSLLLVAISPLAGAIAALLCIAGVLVVVFWLAGRMAAEDPYGTYAEDRNLELHLRGSLPPSTPLLRRGDRRHAGQIMSGELPGGRRGTLALYAYEQDVEEEPESVVDWYDFTVVLVDVAETATRISDLYCQPRDGLRSFDSAEDAFRRHWRLELGNVALDEQYEIFYGPRADVGWLRGLFSADLISWLTEEAPPEFAFELASGSLCVSVEGHLEHGEDLDALCEAAARVAGHLRGQAQVEVPV